MATKNGKTQQTATTHAPAAQESTAERPVVFTPKSFDPNQIVTVRNGFQGRLVYQSKKTGEVFIWENFGAEQDMELSELKSARSSSKKFFINNWFMIDDPEVIDYLGMSQYYKFALKINEFDSLFSKSADEVRKIVSRLSDGQKKSVAYRARQLIGLGEIDSNKVISALEESLGVDLIER